MVHDDAIRVIYYPLNLNLITIRLRQALKVMTNL